MKIILLIMCALLSYSHADVCIDEEGKIILTKEHYASWPKTINIIEDQDKWLLLQSCGLEKCFYPYADKLLLAQPSGLSDAVKDLADAIKVQNELAKSDGMKDFQYMLLNSIVYGSLKKDKRVAQYIEKVIVKLFSVVNDEIDYSREDAAYILSLLAPQRGPSNPIEKMEDLKGGEFEYLLNSSLEGTFKNFKDYADDRDNPQN